jgi:protein involved in polysaccharide export with SLBB domain
LRRTAQSEGPSGSPEWIPVDISSFARGDTSQNYTIEDGDELLIPEDFKNTVNIQGAVQAPNTYQYREGMTLAQLISLARGEVPTRSKMSDITVIRERPGLPGQFMRLKVDYVRFVRKGDASQNLLLMPGDIVVVGSTKNPDINQISSALNAVFFIERFFREGLFGLRGIPGF